jgi:hypothetical protein
MCRIDLNKNNGSTSLHKNASPRMRLYIDISLSVLGALYISPTLAEPKGSSPGDAPPDTYQISISRPGQRVIAEILRKLTPLPEATNLKGIWDVLSHEGSPHEYRTDALEDGRSVTIYSSRLDADPAMGFSEATYTRKYLPIADQVTEHRLTVFINRDLSCIPENLIISEFGEGRLSAPKNWDKLELMAEKKRDVNFARIYSRNYDLCQDGSCNRRGGLYFQFAISNCLNSITAILR